MKHLVYFQGSWKGTHVKSVVPNITEIIKQEHLCVKFQTFPKIPSIHTLKIYCIMHRK